MNKKLSVQVKKVCGDRVSVRVYRFRTVQEYHVISALSLDRLSRILNNSKADTLVTLKPDYISATWYF